MKLLLAILPTVILTLYSQFITKWRIGVLADQVGSATALTRIIRYLGDPLVLSSYAMTLIASFAWFAVLERYELSLAYPIFIGVMFASVTAGGMIFFGEPVTAMRLLAIVLIFMGIIAGTR
jgi:multidrug transporter EmrE-like cation transporter